MANDERPDYASCTSPLFFARPYDLNPWTWIRTPCCINHLAIAAESNLTQEPTRNDGS